MKNRALAAIALLSLLAFPGCVLVFEGGLVGVLCEAEAKFFGPCGCYIVCTLTEEGAVTQCGTSLDIEECQRYPGSGDRGRPRGAGPSYAVPDDAYFALGSYAAGAATSHQIGLTIGPNVYETFAATAVYPPEFAFAGFAPGEVGRLAIDFDQDGADDADVAVFGLGGDAAFADADRNGFPSPFEPTVVHSGAHAFAVSLLAGGDGNPATLTTVAPIRMTLTLRAGILANPPVAGTYALQLDATSVDPDTDGADDAAGAAPLTVTATEDVTIGEGVCPPVPAPGCNETFAKGGLIVKDGEGDRDILKLKGKRGRTAPGFFGDPTLESSHATCVYDERGLLRELAVAAGGTGGNGKPLWKKRGDRASYRDPSAVVGGVYKVGQRSRRKGAAFDVAARGAALDLPILPLQPPVVVQHRTRDGACAEVTFATLSRNDATQAKGAVTP
jgi:hypothetical protein